MRNPESKTEIIQDNPKWGDVLDFLVESGIQKTDNGTYEVTVAYRVAEEIIIIETPMAKRADEIPVVRELLSRYAPENKPKEKLEWTTEDGIHVSTSMDDDYWEWVIDKPNHISMMTFESELSADDAVEELTNRAMRYVNKPETYEIRGSRWTDNEDELQEHLGHSNIEKEIVIGRRELHHEGLLMRPKRF